MGAFVGRRDYLKLLDDTYNDPKFKACALIGRRRIGKSALINEFVKGKDHLRFQFIHADVDTNLAYASEVMSEYLRRKIRYDDVASFFIDLEGVTSSRKVILVIDEYPYICDEEGTVSSMLQHLIDLRIGESFVILCGSSVKMMEREVSEYDRPLFGRLRPIRVKEMTFDECREFHPGMSDEEQLKLYLTVGGVPFYHSDTDAKNYRDYVARYILAEHAVFAEEGENSVNRELSPAEDIYTILDHIPPTGVSLPDLRASTGMDKSTCARCIKTMEDAGVLTFVNPMVGAPRKPRYVTISDPVIAFAFQVLRKKRVTFGDPYASYDRMSNLIDSFLGRRFERFCEEYIRASYVTSSIGKWWGKTSVMEVDGTVHGENREIDVVAEVSDGRNDVVLFVECKFWNRPVGYGVLNDLDESVALIRNRRNHRRMLISRSGFEEDLRNDSDPNLILVDLKTLLGGGPAPEL